MTSVEIPTSVAAALPTLQVFDITNEVARELTMRGVEAGLAYVSPSAPSSLVRVTEREAGFFCDIEDLLARMVPTDRLGREQVVTMLLGPRTEQIPVSGGKLCLGQWQRILVFGFNGHHSADFSLTVVG